MAEPNEKVAFYEKYHKKKKKCFRNICIALFNTVVVCLIWTVVEYLKNGDLGDTFYDFRIRIAPVFIMIYFCLEFPRFLLFLLTCAFAILFHFILNPEVKERFIAALEEPD